jgi:hypothetical protein
MNDGHHELLGFGEGRRAAPAEGDYSMRRGTLTQ